RIDVYLCPSAPPGRVDQQTLDGFVPDLHPNSAVRDYVALEQVNDSLWRAPGALFYQNRGGDGDWDYSDATSAAIGDIRSAFPQVSFAIFSWLSPQPNSRLSEVLDGTSNTIMFIEQAGRPALWRLGKQVTDPANPYSDYSNGGVWTKGDVSW